MTDDTRTTRYLWEFAASGVTATEQQMQQLLGNISRFEAQLQQKIASIDSLLRGGLGGAGGGGAGGVSPGGGVFDPATLSGATAAIQRSQQASQALVNQQATLAQTTTRATSSIQGQTQALRQLSDLQYVMSHGVVPPTQGPWAGYPTGALDAMRGGPDYQYAQWQASLQQASIPEMGREVATEWRDGVQVMSQFEQQFSRVNAVTKESEQIHKRSIDTYNRAGDRLRNVTTETTRLADGSQRVKRTVQTFTEEMDRSTLASSRFIRHLTWIGQGILIWQGINLITSSVRGWADAQVALNSALVDFEMRTGASGMEMAQFRQELIAISQETGTRVTDLGAVAPYAPDDFATRFTAQLNRVAGGNLQNQMQWLVAQQRQFNIEGEDTIQILDAMFSAWRQTTLPMDQFVSMLRDAAPLAEEFNLTMEEMYSLFAGMQAVTGAEGRELDYLSRNLARLYEPSVQRDLGIVTTPIGPDLTMEHRNLIDVLDELHSKIESGEITFAQAADAMGATGRRQLQLFQSMMLGWDGFIGSVNASMDAGAQFESAFGSAMGKLETDIDEVAVAWQNLMATLGDTTLWRAALTSLADALTTIRGLIEGTAPEDMKFATTSDVRTTQYEAMFRLFGRGEDADVERGARNTLDIIRSMLPSYGIPGTGTYLPLAGASGAAAGTSTRGAVPTGPSPLDRFPSMMNIPEGVSFTELMTGMDKWTAAIESLGPQFELWVATHQDSALLYDENTKTLRLITGFLPALQRALAENTQAQKAQQLQPGLRNVDLNLATQGADVQRWIKYYTDYLTRMGFPQEQRPQLLLGIDDTFLRLWASNEALMLAIRSLTEATEDQTDILSGMWNVPEGATMWVPIQSLFYSRQQGGGGGGPLPMPPGTLPEQQPGWGALPGAVDTMSVGNMSVQNWLDFPSMVEGARAEQATTKEDALARFNEAMGLYNNTMDLLRGLLSMEKQPYGRPYTEGEIYLPMRPTQPTAPEPVQALEPYRYPEERGFPPEEWRPSEGETDTGFIGDTVRRILSNAKITAMQVQSSTTELETPTTQVTTPVMTAAITTVDALMATAQMFASTVDLTALTVTGMPDFETSGIETQLSESNVTLTMIYNVLSTMAFSPFQPTATSTSTPPPHQSTVVTPEQLGRIVDRRAHVTFTRQGRMRSF